MSIAAPPRSPFPLDSLDDGARGRLTALVELLCSEPAPTSVRDPEQAWKVHVADSLSGIQPGGLQDATRIADVGAGAGLPGLVLATALPRAHVVLVEAASRKCAFLRSAASAMGLENAEVVWSRAEEWRDGLGRCDVVCARALAPLPVVCEYAAPLLRDDGALVAWKGAVDEAEAADASAASARLGLAADPVRSVQPYPGSERRTLHVLRKVAPTPPNYPRRAGMATKRPLSAKNVR